MGEKGPPVPLVTVRKGAALDAAIAGSDAPPPPGTRLQPLFTLYSPDHVALAAFLGGPVGGTWLLALNFRRLGRAAAAAAAVAFGLLATAALARLAWVWPEEGPGLTFVAVYVFGFFGVARATQGASYARHVEADGPVATNRRAAGVGLLSLVITLAVVFAGAVAWVMASEGAVDFGHGQEVYYEDGATEAQARAVGATLEDIGYFSDDGAAAVAIRESGDGFVVAFWVQDWVFEDDAALEGYRAMAAPLSTEALGGAPVEIQLVDGNGDQRQRLSWQAP